METSVTPYHAALVSYLVLGSLFLAQTLIADAAAAAAGVLGEAGRRLRVGVRSTP